MNIMDTGFTLLALNPNFIEQPLPQSPKMVVLSSSATIHLLGQYFLEKYCASTFLLTGGYNS